jgi:hypothetical protein
MPGTSILSGLALTLPPPLFPLYWKYDRYLQETYTFITDQGSLLDSYHAVITGLREFRGKHSLLKRKVVIQIRCVGRDETLRTGTFC